MNSLECPLLAGFGFLMRLHLALTLPVLPAAIINLLISVFLVPVKIPHESLDVGYFICALSQLLIVGSEGYVDAAYRCNGLQAHAVAD